MSRLVAITQRPLGREFRFCNFELTDDEQTTVCVGLHGVVGGFPVLACRDHLLVTINGSYLDGDIIAALGQALRTKIDCVQ